VSGLLRWDAEKLGQPACVRAVQKVGRQTVEAPAIPEGPGGCRFALSLPAVPDDEGRVSRSEWDLKWVGADGSSHLVDWPRSQAAAATRPRGVGLVAWRRSPRGYARLVADAPLLDVTVATVSAQTIRVELDVSGLDLAEVETLTVSSTRFDVPATWVHHSGATVTAEFPTHISQFGAEPLPLPPGPYWLQVVDVRGEARIAHAGPQLLAQLPLDVETPVLNSRMWMSNTEQVRISLSAPLTVDERGNWAQRQLRTWHQQAEFEPEHSVLFQCYRGEFATDSQRALHEGLVRRGSDLTLYWGVASLGTWVPEGAVPLVIGSRQWYEKLARSTYLCNNIDFDGFFRKRPHQRYLQTFHGYPFKSMGRSFWNAKGFTPERIDRELERRNAEWDAILVPSAMCEPMYRNEYDYVGDVLVTGYPRSDVLVNRQGPEVRAEILRRLGVDPAKTAVLYAPTFRDALTTKTFAARRFDELDLDLLSAALGEDHVILLRGHNNNQREAERLRGRAQILDVTDYPEINDLTIAADVAVLDYSSLRFDWALTGKPMLFFVPDMDDYFAFRQPLFDFAASAPGPLLVTTEDVAAELADLPRLRARYADALSAFNATYNEMHDGKVTDRVLDAFFTAHSG
jgi:CDP-glycerol glycerophosphotransferase